MRLITATLAGASLALLVLVISGFQTIGIGNGVAAETVPSAFAAAETVAVDITQDGFDPSNVTVAIGGTVSWTNRDSDAHSVVGDPGSGLESPAFDRWGIYSRTFNIAGIIVYHDGLQPELTGTITVVDSDGSSPAPGAPASPDRVLEDSAPPASDETRPIIATSESSVAGLVTVEAGNEWFGSANFQNGVLEISIQAGDTVQWSIVEGVHTIYECGDSWSAANSCTGAAWQSDFVAVGDTFSQQFNTPGTFQYLCTLHPLTMRGSITVAGSAPAADPAPPAPSDAGPSTAPPAINNSGPAVSGPEGSTASPDSVPNAGFGPPSSGADLNDYVPLSALVMVAAGLTFLASSAMLIRQRISSASPAAVNGWAPMMVEPPRFRQERADARPATVSAGAHRNATPNLRPWRKPVDRATVPSQEDQVIGHTTDIPERPMLAQDDLEMLRARLASINERFARIAGRVEDR